ncbi:uncharacterized protein LOC130827482 [Amaranthus tricolor]|uniref:uncharacterized protein LOC130827482 n=1 Tax=Amaranthus tricolor TaxID=29722 RepID=UPI00258A7374|nr:uncharacterized protein LOC130827482 [Amaranthus tricolor]
MSSPTTTTLSLFLLISLSLSSSTPTVYDAITNYGLPVGILPKGITDYQLNKQTGEFKLFFPRTCKFSIDGYDLEYKSTISGVISQNRITKLKGVSVRIFIIWLTINEVYKLNDQLQFVVGIVSTNFPLDGFFESPTCGCGFDCDDDNHVLGLNESVSFS